MTFIKPQRQAAPWSDHNWWGQYDEAANLPNTATSDIQVSSTELQRGDMAWAEAEASLYYCDDPTAGAAVWLPLGSGSGGQVALASDYYLSGDNGNDANDGLTPATAVATLGRMLAILNEADIVAQGTPCTVHMGRTTAAGFYEWDRTIDVQLYDDLFFYGDGAGQPGEDGFVELVASTAAIAGSDIQQVQLAAGPIVADNDYIGLTIEILTGAAAGDRRTIRNHSTTQIWPVRPFSAAVAAGDTFRIVQPEIAIVPVEDVNKPGQNAQMHKKAAPVVDVPSGGNEMYDLEFTGTLTVANLILERNAATFAPHSYHGTLRVFGCLYESGGSAGVMTVMANKILAGCDVQNAIYSYYGPNITEPFRLFTGAALSALRAGLTSGIASWSGWGLTVGRFRCNSFLGYIHKDGSASPSWSQAQILGGSFSGGFACLDDARVIFGTRTGTSPTSDSKIPVLFNALNNVNDYGMWVTAGEVNMGNVEFTPATRFGVIVGNDSFELNGGTMPTIKWATNTWQVLACSVAFMYITNGSRLIIGEDIAGATGIDFSGIAGPHVVVGKYEDGPIFEITVPDVRELQEFDTLQAIDGSTVIVLSPSTVPS